MSYFHELGERLQSTCPSHSLSAGMWETPVPQGLLLLPAGRWKFCKTTVEHFLLLLLKWKRSLIPQLRVLSVGARLCTFPTRSRAPRGPWRGTCAPAGTRSSRGWSWGGPQFPQPIRHSEGKSCVRAGNESSGSMSMRERLRSFLPGRRDAARSQFYPSSSRFCYSTVLRQCYLSWGSSLGRNACWKLKMHSPLRRDKNVRTVKCSMKSFRLIYLGISLLNCSTKGKFCNVSGFFLHNCISKIAIFAPALSSDAIVKICSKDKIVNGW